MRTRISKFLFLLVCPIVTVFYPTLNVSGQEMLGLTLGNYSGTAGLLVNPAMITNNKTFLDVNLISADVFFRNNFAYIPAADFNFWSVINGSYVFPEYSDYQQNFLYYNNEQLKNATINVRVLGPSAMIQIGKHGIGVQTGVRFFTSGNRIPFEVPVFGYEGLIYDKLYNIRFKDYDFDFNSASWMEIGLNYGYDIIEHSDKKLTLGVTVKKLWGYSGATVKVNNVDYVIFNDSTISLRNLNADIGFSLPMNYDESGYKQTGSTFKGSGVGLDIGMVFTKKSAQKGREWIGGKLCSQEYEDYKYRLGISILDIGRLQYSENAQTHSAKDVSFYWDHMDTLGYTNMNQLIQDLSSVLYGDPNQSYTGDKLNIGLPTALSVQFDYHIKQSLYVSGFLINPIRFNMNSLRRPAQLAVVPRYELPFFELSIPVSLYEYQYPRIGVAARFYFFTIGTERLGTYLGMADMNGMDIYTSIKFSFGKGSCRSLFGGACSNSDFGNKLLKRKRK
ncbi:MAG: DUF5723 family protein [Bacteroidales bacterium]